MVPKVINYCWFGGNELTSLAKKCIASWKKYCPDYKIVRWDESNYPIEEKCQFVQDAYKNKKWAFVSDYARLDIIHQHGGIYLDTDVEIIAPLGKLIEKTDGRYFGWQDNRWVASGLGFAMPAGEPILREMMRVYEDMTFYKDKLADFTCPVINSMVLQRHGLIIDGSFQNINGISILPVDYLCPVNLSTGIRHFSENTYSIHHFDGSWMNDNERRRMRFYIFVKKILPSSFTQKIRKAARNILNLKNDDEEK